MLRERAPVEAYCLPNIARLSIPAFRAGDPGSNPGRSTKNHTNKIAKIVPTKHSFLNIDF